jgi:hypothetical protein
MSARKLQYTRIARSRIWSPEGQALAYIRCWPTSKLISRICTLSYLSLSLSLSLVVGLKICLPRQYEQVMYRGRPFPKHISLSHVLFLSHCYMLSLLFSDMKRQGKKSSWEQTFMAAPLPFQDWFGFHINTFVAMEIVHKQVRKLHIHVRYILRIERVTVHVRARMGGDS